MSAAEAPERRRTARLGVVAWFWLSIGLLVVVAVAGVVAGLLALSSLGDARHLIVDRLDPASAAAQGLRGDLLNQETGVRGFLLAGDETFLKPYVEGRRAEQRTLARLQRLLGGTAGLGDDVQRLGTAAERWRTGFAVPTIAGVRRGGERPTRREEARGKALFDAFRASTRSLDGDVASGRATARSELASAANAASSIFVIFGIVLLASVLATAIVLRRVVAVPLGRLAEVVRDVAGGTFDRRVRADGAREVRELGHDVEGMRERIVQEIEALRVARDDLQRSNAELEQFAYVASHDLQEPLRKVASFCQMLQRRYGGQLDERGEQYIEFAVDGAKRMQDLINDLLAFSRVGRLAEPEVVISCDELVARVTAALAEAIEAADARVEAGPLPAVRGEPSLLGLVFQNLIANGIKFRGDEAPVVRVSARRDGDRWEFCVADNGIGIDAEYADRIFIIFQRLHSRAEYEGTGIGLAMCRKIIEYHGGTIWLDSDAGRTSSGTTFRFTLPAIDDEEPS